MDHACDLFMPASIGRPFYRSELTVAGSDTCDIGTVNSVHIVETFPLVFSVHSDENRAMTNYDHKADRYVVETSRSGHRWYVVEKRSHAIVLTLGGPDCAQLATRIAHTLNASPTEYPVEVADNA